MALLTSPHAHARIICIDTCRAEALEGVALILNHRNTPDPATRRPARAIPSRARTTTACSTPRSASSATGWPRWPPRPRTIAEEAVKLIDVEYESAPRRPVDRRGDGRRCSRHPRRGRRNGIWDAPNIVAAPSTWWSAMSSRVRRVGRVVETTTETQYAQHTPLEPHIVQSYLDDARRLVLYSTQVPFHVRRIVARLLDIPSTGSG